MKEYNKIKTQIKVDETKEKAELDELIFLTEYETTDFNDNFKIIEYKNIIKNMIRNNKIKTCFQVKIVNPITNHIIIWYKNRTMIKVNNIKIIYLVKKKMIKIIISKATIIKMMNLID